MMMRYLNDRIPRNTDLSKALQVRVVSVYPRAVSMEWTDKNGGKHQWSVSGKEMEVFPDAINQQVDNWGRLLFEISGGKFSLKHTIRRSDRELVTLTRRERDGRYWLSPTPATQLVRPQREVMLYIFWLPMWGGNPRMVGGASYSGPQGRFACHYITVHTDRNRLLDPRGWVQLDRALPHEFWHYLRMLARENGFKGFMPDDDAPGEPDWVKLKGEIEKQGLPVPQYAHEEQYSNVLTWSFVEKFKRRYEMQRQ